MPTVQPTADKKPGVGDIVLSDDFSSPADWNTAVADQASVAVTEGGLTIAAQPGIAPIASFRQGQVFSDMYVEVTARPSLCRGPDAYGLVFRAPNNVAYYRLCGRVRWHGQRQPDQPGLAASVAASHAQRGRARGSTR